MSKKNKKTIEHKYLNNDTQKLAWEELDPTEINMENMTEPIWELENIDMNDDNYYDIMASMRQFTIKEKRSQSLREIRRLGKELKKE